MKTILYIAILSAQWKLTIILVSSNRAEYLSSRLCSILSLSHAGTENKQVLKKQTKCRLKSALRLL